MSSIFAKLISVFYSTAQWQSTFLQQTLSRISCPIIVTMTNFGCHPANSVTVNSAGQEEKNVAHNGKTFFHLYKLKLSNYMTGEIWDLVSFDFTLYRYEKMYIIEQNRNAFCEIFFFNPRLYYIYSKYIHIDNSLRREWVPHVLSGNLFKCKQFPLSRVIINFLRAQFQTIYKWLERRAAQCAVTSRNVRLARSSDAFVTTWKTMRFAECSSAARMERMIDAHISDALVAFVGVSSSSWFAVITSATLDALFCQRARTIDTPLVRFIHPDFFLECTITPERHPTTIDSTANYLAVSCMWNNAD